MSRPAIRLFFAALTASVGACGADPSQSGVPDAEPRRDVGGADTPEVREGPEDDPEPSDIGSLDALTEAGPDAGACHADGCPCTSIADCDGGYCVRIDPTTSVCTSACTGTCPLDGWECTALDQGTDVVAICLPESDTYCTPCLRDVDCGSTLALCLEQVDGAFCAPPCVGDALCPEGAECSAVVVGGTTYDVCVPRAGVCAGCFDRDGDTYGEGPGCSGNDCDDLSATTFAGAPELCDGADNNCDEVVDDGFDLATDPAHCGGCGAACDTATSASSCVEGVCVVDSCAERHLDCDGDPNNGCEASGAALNPCGGCGSIAEDVGTRCGTCGSGSWVCDGVDAAACAGDAGDAALNACGGCTALGAAVGGPCGTCDSGAWACDGTDALACDGDGGDGALNPCGGCGALTAAPGDACGTCGSGSTVCNGRDAILCVGDRGVASVNACGGCATLGATVGSSCGTCGSGGWACDGVDALACYEDGGESARNACGGCATLPTAPGTACGTCSSGTTVCADSESVTCGGDGGDAARNACGGCVALGGAPGDACGTCGSGALVCSGAEGLVCVGDRGAASLNPCGGCAVLPFGPGTACGTCGSGTWSCDGADSVACLDDGGVLAQNLCGGCTSLAGTPGETCGTCGSGAWACAGTTAVVCAGDLGEGARNACGGCSALADLPGAACGVCADGEYACNGPNAVTCSGASRDSDGDGVCDPSDRCPGFSDSADRDTDGTPDGCDPCPDDSPNDSDADGVCNSADRCPGADDRLDADVDGVANACDLCRGFDDTLDGDGDGKPDGCDCDATSCGTGASCTESPTGTTCGCGAGYELIGRGCVDVDECARGTDACDPNATCANTTGSYTCTCRRAYTGDGRSCACSSGRIAVEEIGYSYADLSGLTDTGIYSDDVVVGPLSLGFSFPFFGQTRSSLYISSNGFVSFGPTVSGTSSQSLPNPADPSDLIALWWTDLDPYQSGAVGYATVGTAPNRVFVVEYYQVAHYGDDWFFGPLRPVTVELQLFEGTNEFIVSCVSCATDGSQHTLGAESAGGAYGGNAVRTTSAIGGRSWRFATCGP